MCVRMCVKVCVRVCVSVYVCVTLTGAEEGLLRAGWSAGLP